MSKVSIYTLSVRVLIRLTSLTWCLARSLCIFSSVRLRKFRYLIASFDELRVVCSLAIIFVLCSNFKYLLDCSVVH